MASSPPKSLGIPMTFRAPEATFTPITLQNHAADLWAQGCTLHCIRTSKKELFSDGFGSERSPYLTKMVDALGPLPEPWWSSSWEGRREIFFDAPDEQGRAVRTPDFDSRDAVEDRPRDRSQRYRVTFRPRSISKYLAEGMLLKRPDGEEDVVDIPGEEVALLENLLVKLLDYQPERRIPAREVLEHPWLRCEGRGPGELAMSVLDDAESQMPEDNDPAWVEFPGSRTLPFKPGFQVPIKSEAPTSSQVQVPHHSN